MANTKPITPVKTSGKGSKGRRPASKTPATTTLRRSTRKTTQSMKKLEAFATAVGVSEVAVAKARAKKQAAATSKAQTLKPSGDGAWTDSPKKKASPAKRTTFRASQDRSDDDDFEEDDEQQNETRGATIRQASVGGIRKSIEPTTPSKPFSKVRGAGVSKAKANSKAAVAKATRAHPKSPAKTKTGSSPKKAVASPSRKGSAISTRTRSRSPANKNTSGVTAETDFTVPKTRSSRSLSKTRHEKATRSRSHSTVKDPTHNFSDHGFGAASCRVRPRSKSPLVACRTRTRKPCPATFEQRYRGHDEYGEALRTIERAAFENPDLGPISGEDLHDLQLDEDHARRARERGIERAETQAAFRGLADNCEQSLTGGIKVRSGRPLKKTGTRSVSKSRSRSLPAAEEDDTPTRLSPTKRNARQAAESPRRRLVHSQSPASARSKAIPDKPVPLPKGVPSAPGRGAVRSATNPEFIPGTRNTKKNPFFETMPGPEVWHRRMPSFLPFGETPFMEREISRQISQDLAQGNEPTVRPGSAAGGVLNTFRNLFKGKAATDDHRRVSPWELPEVSEADVQKLVNENERRAGSNNGNGAAKRKAPDSASPPSPKRPRR